MQESGGSQETFVITEHFYLHSFIKIFVHTLLSADTASDFALVQ